MREWAHGAGLGIHRAAMRFILAQLIRVSWLRIEHSIKPSMAQNWRNYAAYYVIPYIGQRDVQEIDGTVCDALYAKLLAEGRVKARPKKRPTTRAVHTRRTGPAAGHCRAAPTAMTPCGASALTPRTIR